MSSEDFIEIPLNPSIMVSRAKINEFLDWLKLYINYIEKNPSEIKFKESIIEIIKKLQDINPKLIRSKKCLENTKPTKLFNYEINSNLVDSNNCLENIETKQVLSVKNIGLYSEIDKKILDNLCLYKDGINLRIADNYLYNDRETPLPKFNSWSNYLLYNPTYKIYYNDKYITLPGIKYWKKWLELVPYDLQENITLFINNENVIVKRSVLNNFIKWGENADEDTITPEDFINQLMLVHPKLFGLENSHKYIEDFNNKNIDVETEINYYDHIENDTEIMYDEDNIEQKTVINPYGTWEEYLEDNPTKYSKYKNGKLYIPNIKSWNYWFEMREHIDDKNPSYYTIGNLSKQEKENYKRMLDYYNQYWKSLGPDFYNPQKPESQEIDEAEKIKKGIEELEEITHIKIDSAADLEKAINKGYDITGRDTNNLNEPLIQSNADPHIGLRPRRRTVSYLALAVLIVCAIAVIVLLYSGGFGAHRGYIIGLSAVGGLSALTLGGVNVFGWLI